MDGGRKVSWLRRGPGALECTQFRRARTYAEPGVNHSAQRETSSYSSPATNALFSTARRHHLRDLAKASISTSASRSASSASLKKETHLEARHLLLDALLLDGENNKVVPGNVLDVVDVRDRQGASREKGVVHGLPGNARMVCTLTTAKETSDIDHQLNGDRGSPDPEGHASSSLPGVDGETPKDVNATLHAISNVTDPPAGRAVTAPVEGLRALAMGPLFRAVDASVNKPSAERRRRGATKIWTYRNHQESWVGRLGDKDGGGGGVRAEAWRVIKTWTGLTWDQGVRKVG